MLVCAATIGGRLLFEEMRYLILRPAATKLSGHDRRLAQFIDGHYSDLQLRDISAEHKAGTD